MMLQELRERWIAEKYEKTGKNPTALCEEVLRAIKDANSTKGYQYFGVRGDEFSHQIGQILEQSCDWDYENDCPSSEKLCGACCTGIEALWLDEESKEDNIDKIKKAIEFHFALYNYKHIAIIGGKTSEHGVQEREMVIENATVLYKLI